MGRKRKLPKGIREKGKGFEARAQVNGVKICIYGEDLEQLLKDLEIAKNRARGNMDFDPEKITLDEWYGVWFNQVKVHKIKETSIAPMNRVYKRTFGFHLGAERIKDIRPLDIQRSLNAMHSDGIATSTLKDGLVQMRDCMEYALANQLIKSNPCIVIEIPWSIPKAEEEIALTQEEQNDFLSYMEDNWYKELFYFMCLSGVRVGEAGALKWNDIDFDKKTVRIKGSLSCQYCEGVKRMVITAPKTVNSIRTIPFLGEMEEILRSQKAKQDRLKEELGGRFRSSGDFDDLVFTTTMGSPCVRYIVQKEINKYLDRRSEEEAALAVKEGRKPRTFRKFHPHTLRHTFATRCFEKGMDPKVVQKLMGHSNISITLNIYTHVMESKMASELEKFGYANTTDREELKKMAKPVITSMSHT